MTRYHKALGVLLVALFGALGMWRGPATQSIANGDRVKALETKTAKLEEELKSALAFKEQLRTQLAEAADSQVRLQQEVEQLQSVVKDRDELKRDLRARTTERDHLQVQYESFRKNIKDLLGQAETSLHNDAKPNGLASRNATGPSLPSMGEIEYRRSERRKPPGYV